VGRKVIVGIRPSDFEDAAFADASWAKIPVTAGVTEELGSEVHVIFTIDAPPVDHPSISDAARGDGEEEDEAGVVALAGGKSLWTARVSARSAVRPGTSLELGIDTSRLHFFDPDTGLALG
jgi:multiple sugar transport system ATP-binding protein